MTISKPVAKSFVALAIALFALAGCVDSKYDLNNISTDVTVGIDGMALPVLFTDTLRLDSLMYDAYSEFYVNDQGVYAFAAADTVEFAMPVPALSDVSAFTTTFSPIDIAFEKVYSDDVAAVKISKKFQKSDNMTFTAAVPKEVVAVDRIVFADRNELLVNAELRLLVDRSAAGTFRLDDVTVKFPDFLEIVPIDDNTIDSDNVMHLGTITYDSSTDKYITLAAFVISSVRNVAVDNKVLSVNSDLSVSGTLVIAKGTPLDATSSSVTLSPYLISEAATPTWLYGRVNYDYSDEVSAVDTDLSFFTSYMGDYDANLDVVGAVASVEAVNPLGVDMNCKLRVSAFETSGKLIKYYDIDNIAIAAADGTKSTTTKLLLTSDQSVVRDGYTTFYTEAIDSLILKFPDKLRVRYYLTADQTKQHAIRLNRDMNFVLYNTYDFPMQFKAGSFVTFTDQKTDMDDDFDKIASTLNDISDVTLNLEYSSNIPFDFDVDFNFVDSLAESLDAATVDLTDRIAGSPDGSEVTTKLSARLAVKDNNSANLSDIFGYKVRFTGTASADRAALRPEQYLRCKAWLTVGKGGVSVNIDSLKNNF